MPENDSSSVLPVAVGGGLVLAALGGLWWHMAKPKTSTSSTSADPSAASAYLPPPEGVSVKNGGVKLNARMVAFLAALRAELGPDVPLLVTSGARTVAEQVREMLDQFKTEGAAAVSKLYRSNAELVASIVAALASGDLDAAGKAVSDAAAKGIYLSDHLDYETRPAQAVDLRRWNWSSDQLAQVKAAVSKLGARSVEESDHLHVEDIPAPAA